MDNLFDDNGDTVDTPAPKFEDLVGEGKKYKDNDAAAKAIAEKDRFIAQLQDETKGLRTELNTRLTLEQAVDRIASQAPPPPSHSSESNPPREPDHQAQPALTPEAIAEIVTKTMTDKEKTAARSRNLSYVEDKLQEAFGPNYKRTINEQAAKLGLGKDWLQQLALDQPNAFLKLLDVQPQAQVNPTSVSVPQSSVRSDGFNFRPDNGVKRKSHFDEIRRKDPSRYWTPAVQNEIHKEAQKQGEGFFDT